MTEPDLGYIGTPPTAADHEYRLNQRGPRAGGAVAGPFSIPAEAFPGHVDLSAEPMNWIRDDEVSGHLDFSTHPYPTWVPDEPEE